jgi:hypothetical protein
VEKIKKDFVKACVASDKIRRDLKKHPDTSFAAFMAKRLREIENEQEEFHD